MAISVNANTKQGSQIVQSIYQLREVTNRLNDINAWMQNINQSQLDTFVDIKDSAGAAADLTTIQTTFANAVTALQAAALVAMRENVIW